MKTSPPTLPSAPSSDEAAERPRVNILLVDDRPDKLLAMQVILEGLGECVVSVPSGKEALRRLLREDFAVILLDVNMPGMDGFETAALIRRRPRSEATPIIFISEIDHTNNHVARGYSLGAVDYIASPVVPEILRAKVGVFVELYRKTEQVRQQAAEHARLVQEQTARSAAEAEQQRMALLAEASEALSTTLDQHRMFEHLARLLVPRLGELCVIDIVAGDGGLHQVAFAVTDPVLEGELRALDGWEQAHFARRALETGRAELSNEATPELLARTFSEPATGVLLRRLRPTAYLTVPIHARQRLAGALTLVSAAEGHVLGPRTFALAENLALRASVALENANLYRKAHEARLEAERASRAKDEFLAMLSHELRTPLTPVLATVLGLSEDADTPASLRPHLQLIRRNVELETRLIDDLLDLTAISRGKLRLRLEVQEAHEILQAAVGICRPELEAHELVLDCVLSAVETHIAADSARLQQVFWNLLKNAVKFTPRGGRIAVRTANPQPGQLLLEFSDSGLGIEPSQLGRIFDAFEQADRKHFGGLGLGLAISRSLVALHQGEIVAESAGPGLGATFRITLPVVAAPARPPAGPAAPRPPTAGGGQRVLLVEDNEDTNASLTWLLRRRGFEVVSADSVGAAIRLIDSHWLDVLVSDLGLPDGSGLQVLQHALGKQPGIHAIALSGFGMSEDLLKSREAGFRHHLVKPVDVQKLEEAIRARESAEATDLA